MILKVYEKPEEYDEAPAREYAGLNILRPLDIAPEPEFFHPGDPTHPKPIVIYEFILGKMWGRTPIGPD